MYLTLIIIPQRKRTLTRYSILNSEKWVGIGYSLDRKIILFSFDNVFLGFSRETHFDSGKHRIFSCGFATIFFDFLKLACSLYSVLTLYLISNRSKSTPN